MLCSEIVVAYPNIEEMNLNPVIVHEKGISIVDARVILKSEDRSQMTEIGSGKWECGSGKRKKMGR